MTTDIVERLRALVILDEMSSDNPLGREAADVIERLRAENEQLKIALSDRPRDDGTVVAVGGEPGASAGKSE